MARQHPHLALLQAVPALKITLKLRRAAEISAKGRFCDEDDDDDDDIDAFVKR